MIYYIINGIFLTIISIFEYRRYKVVKSLKDVDLSVKARYEWKGWYCTGTPNDKFSVFFTLKEIVKSKDGSKIKFEVLDLICERTKENTQSDLEHYEEEFYNRTGGGWLNANNPDLFYFDESRSLYEERNKKLEILGIK